MILVWKKVFFLFIQGAPPIDDDILAKFQSDKIAYLLESMGISPVERRGDLLSEMSLAMAITSIASLTTLPEIENASAQVASWIQAINQLANSVVQSGRTLSSKVKSHQAVKKKDLASEKSRLSKMEAGTKSTNEAEVPGHLS